MTNEPPAAPEAPRRAEVEPEAERGARGSGPEPRDAAGDAGAAGVPAQDAAGPARTPTYDSPDADADVDPPIAPVTPEEGADGAGTFPGGDKRPLEAPAAAPEGSGSDPKRRRLDAVPSAQVVLAGSRLWRVRVDVSKPLGISFGDECVATKVVDGMQAATLRVPAGARARLFGGRLLESTSQLVKLVQKAKRKGFTEVVMGFALPPITAVFSARPFGFAIKEGGPPGAFIVVRACGPAEARGVTPGCLLTAVNGDPVAGPTKEDVGKQLGEASLPVRLVFELAMPKRAEKPADLGPVVSSSEDEGAPAKP